MPQKNKNKQQPKNLGGKRELKSGMKLMKQKLKKHKISTNQRLGSLKGLIQTRLCPNESEERGGKHPK